MSAFGDQDRWVHFELYGFAVTVDVALGHLAVEHDGSVTWDQLQAIKLAAWGPDARAIEVYPRQADVVNSCNMRHLWRLGDGDFAPDLLGRTTHDPMMVTDDLLQIRHRRAWAEAHA